MNAMNPILAVARAPKAENAVEVPAYHEQPKPKGGCNFTDWSGGEKPKPLATNTNLSDLLAHCGMGL